MARYTLGVDYGTDSVRVLLVDVDSGEEIATAVSNYPRWAQQLYCDASADRFRQHPQDYIDSLEDAMAQLWQQVPAATADNILGLSFDTTGSTPVAVNSEGTPLALTAEFAENPNAMFILWKDHTAVKEAAEITAAAQRSEPNYLRNMGGIYSSEWLWAKILHTLRQDEPLRKAAHSWVEHCDWMTALVTGQCHPSVFRMGRCAAGHKGMWCADWNGFPPNSFFVGIDPLLDGVVDSLNPDTETAGVEAGRLTAEWAQRLGLKEGTIVGYGAFDCHMGAVGANVKPGVLTKVMGTSTCDITVSTYEDLGDTCVRGICGQVDGSVLPGVVGLEAGQSAFGDLYAWFKNFLAWPLLQLPNQFDDAAIDAFVDGMIPALSAEAEKLPPGAGKLVALDWVNGRRTPDADQTVAMAIAGMKMGTTPAHVFRALVEATAFGSRAINERFKDEGIDISSVVTIGGISKKSDFVMQVCADIWNCQIDVLESDQSCALGAAILSAVAAGVYPTVEAAQSVMASPVCKQYQPNAENAAKYDAIYRTYQSLGGFVNGASA